MIFNVLSEIWMQVKIRKSKMAAKIMAGEAALFETIYQQILSNQIKV